MKSFVRQLVSKKKRRFQSDGFDLDLTYITPRIIAMGYPAQGVEAMYRNDMHQVKNFLTTFHDQRFKVYNLCSERDYDPAKLGGNVMRIPFEDHNPAPLPSILLFSNSASEWLAGNSENVVVVHCKAGKGRAGLMICALLLALKMFANAEAAIEFYGQKRTTNGKGVTIPSQMRYLRYFEDVIEHGLRAEPQLLLNEIRITGAASDLHFTISSSTCLFSSKEVNVIREEGSVTYHSNSIKLTGDVKVFAFQCKLYKEVRQFYFWFNTCYVEGSFLLKRKELDKRSQTVSPFIEVSMLLTRI